jgi:hypothetical protein
MVRGSRIVAPMRPTIAAAVPGRRFHCSRYGVRRRVWMRRNASHRGPPGASVTDRGTATELEDGRGRGSRARATNRVTKIFGQQARDANRPGSSICTIGSLIASRPVGSGGDRAFRGPARAAGDRPQADRPAGARSGRTRRTTPRRSRSSRRTRAAPTRSRSVVIVLASQSMYDGSNAAISPSVWPRNLPNPTSCARASGSDGAGARRKRWIRPRSRGPFGSEARGGSRSAARLRRGGWPERPAPRPVVALRGRNVSLVSSRPVTGRLGRGRGGPPRRRTGSFSSNPRPLGVPPAARMPARRCPSSRRSASYASLISAMSRVAVRDADGSSPVRSG